MHVSARDGAGLPCGDSRGTPRSMSSLEWKPQFPAWTLEEDLKPGTDWRGIPRGLSQVAWKLHFPEVTPAGHRGPCRNSRGTCHNSRKTRRFSPPGEMRPFSTEASQGKSHLPSSISKGSFMPLQQLKTVPNIPDSTQEDHRGSRHNSRGAPFPPSPLEMRICFPSSLGKDSRLSRRN